MTARTEPRRVSLPATAMRLGLTWHATWARVLRGELDAEQVGGRWYVDEASIDAYLARREAQAATGTRPAA